MISNYPVSILRATLKMGVPLNTGVPVADEAIKLHGEEQPHRAGGALAEEGRLRGRRHGRRRRPLPQHGADLGRRERRENSNAAEGVLRHARGSRRGRRERRLEEAGGEVLIAQLIHGNDQVAVMLCSELIWCLLEPYVFDQKEIFGYS